MLRLSVALLFALCCHGLFALFPVSKDKPTAPLLPGDNTIKISLAGTVIVESEADDSESWQDKSQKKSNQDEVEIQPEEKEKQLNTPVPQIPEPVVQQQETQAPVIIKPLARKKHYQSATTARLTADSPVKEKLTADIPLSSENVGSTTSATALPAIVKAEPLYKQNPKPAYPALARRRGWQGTVLLAVTVLEDGRPDLITLHKSSGYELLDTSAVKTVKTWHFLPGMENGRPQSMEILIPVRFKLN